eukprot:CAMPEP_0180148992 /NCGR_PEP_ID=MMETSP0986-20121125/20449_1 /TAXON_ID=697907 /ORGANISM="non described non described, Strain CCMP2293" /LENGTH=204 /DNA_ID=CAMNT_0022095373 /DNA_START=118 /DNA_END=729 /DNA_ORIENTATION=-
MSSPGDAIKAMGLSENDFNMSGSQITPLERDKAKKILDACIKHPDNRHCVDCNTLGPRWASMNLGIFMCLNCSGIHRRMGTHISKVKSTNLDMWKVKWADWMKGRGNINSNLYFEGNTPRSWKKPDENSSAQALEDHIRAKYERKEWAQASSAPAALAGPAAAAVASGAPAVGSFGAGFAKAMSKKDQEGEDFKMAQKLQAQLN